MEFITEELKPLAQTMANMIGNELEKEDHVTGRKIEEGLRECLRDMGRMTFGMVLTKCAELPEREIACECGGQAILSAQAEGKGAECL